MDKLLDTAQQKGTGKWMSQHALDLGVPTTLITEAVFARCLSAQKDARVRASKVLSGPMRRSSPATSSSSLRTSGRLCTHRSFAVMRRVTCSWMRRRRSSDGSSTTARSRCCGVVAASFGRDSWKTSRKRLTRTPNLENLLLDDFFKSAIDKAQPSWRRVVSTAIQLGLPVPAFSAALTYYDGYRQSRLPANLLQAQRDYFGAHTYERTDKPRGQAFHTDWIRERSLK